MNLGAEKEKEEGKEKEKQRLGIALRPTVFSHFEMKKIVEYCDSKYKRYTHVFLPDIMAQMDPVELSIWLLSSTSTVRVGPGVIRLLEHDVNQLARRVSTIQRLSSNRLILGVGVGRPKDKASSAISELFNRLAVLKDKLTDDLPEIFVAALKTGIAKKAVERNYTPLLNFCSSDYAGRISKRLEGIGDAGLACYIKVFYSAEDDRAVSNMVKEFTAYNMIPQYHQLFVIQGLDRDIERLGKATKLARSDLPSFMLHICPVNPQPTELQKFIDDMRNSGVSLPVLYPYFDESDSEEFRLRKIEELLSSLH
ncbi:MAG: LLM class flavin-dependent oxidoreductase [Conexivisphaerales archaeon]